MCIRIVNMTLNNSILRYELYSEFLEKVARDEFDSNWEICFGVKFFTLYIDLESDCFSELDFNRLSFCRTTALSGLYLMQFNKPTKAFILLL